MRPASAPRLSVLPSRSEQGQSGIGGTDSEGRSQRVWRCHRRICSDYQVQHLGGSTAADSDNRGQAASPVADVAGRWRLTADASTSSCLVSGRWCVHARALAEIMCEAEFVDFIKIRSAAVEMWRSRANINGVDTHAGDSMALSEYIAMMRDRKPRRPARLRSVRGYLRAGLVR